MIEVDFQHWRCEIPIEALKRFDSPYFDEREAGGALTEMFETHKHKERALALEFRPEQILCGNEAFPEAAVSDPLADLELWDEWDSGIRAFPYPGKYHCLGITGQEGKTSSATSVGALGEVMAGLLAQEGIAPWVLVRVIRRWPDFIFYAGNGRYAFVEAKAFTGASSGGWVGGVRCEGRVPAGLLAELLVDAVRQINADGFVSVWGAFTGVMQITPMKLLCTFVEMVGPDELRAHERERVVPEAVLVGLAERALSRALGALESWELEEVLGERAISGRSEHKPGTYEAGLLTRADGELEKLLVESGIETGVADALARGARSVRELWSKTRLGVPREGRRLTAAKALAVGGKFGRVRSLGGRSVYVADLPPSAVGTISRSWQRHWERANAPLASIAGTDVWRCGGAAIALSDASLEGVEYPADSYLRT